MFNEIISQHFMNPKNTGELRNPDFVIEISNPICGDTIHMFLEVESECITKVSYLSYGCSTSIATASIISEVIKEKTFNEISKFNREDVIKWLGELEPAQSHCIDIGYSLIKEAASPTQTSLKKNDYLVEDKDQLYEEIDNLS